MTQLLFPIDPEPDESCMGWALRTARANYLPSPWHLFRHAGLAQSNMSVLQFSAARLSASTGTSFERLKPLECSEGSERAARVQFRGHSLRRTLIRNRVPQICPMCLAQRPIAVATWDLRPVVACPLHRVKLLSRCQECQQRYSWLRPDVDTCRCGAKLSSALPERASDGAVIASAALEVALARDPAAWRVEEEIDAGLLAAWASIPLSQLAHALFVLARLAGGFEVKVPACDHYSAMDAAGAVLARWPSGLYQALDVYTAREAETSGRSPRRQGSVSPVDIANSVAHQHRAWCRRWGGGQRDFLSDHMLQYLAERAPAAANDPRRAQRLADAGVVPQWFALGQAAKRIAVHPHTLKDMVADGRVESRVDRRGGAGKVLVHTSSLEPRLGQCKPVGIREANRRTGLPVSVLKGLHAAGDLRSSRQMLYGQCLLDQDLSALVRRWEGLKVSKPPPGKDMVDLRCALRRRLGKHQLEWKVDLVRRVLRGDIKIYGKSMDAGLDATLAELDVLQVRSAFAKANVGLGMAATMLSLTRKGVIELMAAQCLSPVFDRDSVSVTSQGLDEFRRRYVRLSSLSKGLRQAEVLAQECVRVGVPIWRAEDRYGAAMFVETKRARAALARLKERLGCDRSGRLNCTSLSRRQ